MTNLFVYPRSIFAGLQHGVRDVDIHIREQLLGGTLLEHAHLEVLKSDDQVVPRGRNFGDLGQAAPHDVDAETTTGPRLLPGAAHGAVLEPRHCPLALVVHGDFVAGVHRVDHYLQGLREHPSALESERDFLPEVRRQVAKGFHGGVVAHQASVELSTAVGGFGRVHDDVVVDQREKMPEEALDDLGDARAALAVEVVGELTEKVVHDLLVDVPGYFVQ